VGLALLPWLMVGLINRTKARWAGRLGPPLLQSVYDVLRLCRKRPVYSETTTAIFRLTPYVGLAATLAAALVVPIVGFPPLWSFSYDFIWLAYLWGLGRAALMLGALDTGSSFEGMGASREATFATLVEPALLLVMGALGATTGATSLMGAVSQGAHSIEALVAWGASLFALLVVVQAEGARMPVDDPTTHLELTMIHEVMVLDHSGPELAAIQITAALKLTLGASLIAALLNPWTGSGPAATGLVVHLLLMVMIAVVIGTIESLWARFQLPVLHRYLFMAVVGGAVALLATTWQGGGL
jgi:formate hydrogenlyase subunit 4